MFSFSRGKNYICKFIPAITNTISPIGLSIKGYAINNTIAVIVIIKNALQGNHFVSVFFYFVAPCSFLLVIYVMESQDTTVIHGHGIRQNIRVTMALGIVCVSIFTAQQIHIKISSKQQFLKKMKKNNIKMGKMHNNNQHFICFSLKYCIFAIVNSHSKTVRIELLS